MKHELTSLDKGDVRRKITAAVKLYLRDKPDEAELFFDFVAKKRAGLIDESGEVVDGVKDHALERALFEMPVGLYEVIFHNLTAEEFTWWKTKEGARWFARNFKKFALVEV